MRPRTKLFVENHLGLPLMIVFCALIAFPSYSWCDDYTGHWTGTRTGSIGIPYSLTINITQTGATLAGTVSGSDSDCQFSGVPISGTVTSSDYGSNAAGTFYFNCPKYGGTLTAVLEGYLISDDYYAAGNIFVGIYNLYRGTAIIDSGNFRVISGTYELTVTVTGGGVGMVKSDPYCFGFGECKNNETSPHSCSCNYNATSHVILTATADTGLAFSGWTGGGCSGTGTCTVSMDSAKTVTATFGVDCSAPQAMIERTSSKEYYSKIQDAYDDFSDWDAEIKIRGANFIENLLLQYDYEVALKGGYDCAFSNNPDWTTINGSLTVRDDGFVRDGAVKIENIIIK